MSRLPPSNDAHEAYTGETIAIPRRQRPSQPAPAPRRRFKPSPWRRIRLVLLALVGLLLLALLLFYLQLRGVAEKVVVRDPRPDAPLATPLLGAVNVLIVGVDERRDNPQEGVRSDTLILAHLDAPGRWMSLLSVPRDTQVELPEVGTSKINVAYGQGFARAEELFGNRTAPRQGGMGLAAQTVDQLLDLRQRGQRIDYIAQVNFEGFAQIIDALGGVSIDVPKYILDEDYPTEDFQTKRVEFQPGVQRMDGATALIYARTRHADSDFDRSTRQQQVLRAIMIELKRRGVVGMALAAPGLLAGLEGTVATTMPIDRLDVLLALAWLGSGLNPDEIGQVGLNPISDPQYQEDGSNLIWSRDGIRAVLDTWLTRPNEVAEAARVQVLNGTDIAGLAGRVSGELESAGFTMVPADNAPVTVEKTIVYDLNRKPRTSRRLAALLKAEVRSGPAPEGVASTADIVVIIGRDAAQP